MINKKWLRLEKHEKMKWLTPEKQTPWFQGSMIANFGIYELIKCYRDCLCTDEGHEFEVNETIKTTDTIILKMLCKIP